MESKFSSQKSSKTIGHRISPASCDQAFLHTATHEIRKINSKRISIVRSEHTFDARQTPLFHLSDFDVHLRSSTAAKDHEVIVEICHLDISLEARFLLKHLSTWRRFLQGRLPSHGGGFSAHHDLRLHGIVLG